MHFLDAGRGRFSGSAHALSNMDFRIYNLLYVLSVYLIRYRLLD
jgi:hypothetical protein